MVCVKGGGGSVPGCGCGVRGWGLGDGDGHSLWGSQTTYQRHAADKFTENDLRDERENGVGPLCLHNSVF